MSAPDEPAPRHQSSAPADATAEDPERVVYQVEEFARRLQGYLRRVRGVWLEGELSAVRRNDAWATAFLTLKGPSGATVDVQVPRRRFDALGVSLTEGERVQVRVDLDLFDQRGTLVLRAGAIERVGVGTLLAQIEERKRRLAAEGLFAAARKRPLPRVPRVVGVLTGADAAARGDILAAFAGRFPALTVVVAEVRVQGAGAPQAIVTGLQRLASDTRVEVVVLTRGGGSLEDLLPFSDERVVRAVAACRVPVVSAVGHEQDTPLCDLAADARAATPTAAVRLVAPDAGELSATLETHRARMARAVQLRVVRARDRLSGQRVRGQGALQRAVARDATNLERQHERLRAAPRVLLDRRRGALDLRGAQLQALSPHATLARGYAIVRSAGTALREANAVTVGAGLEIEIHSGSLRATVDEVRP